MSEKATVLVSEVKVAKEGDSKRGHWVFYLLIDGNEEAYGWLDGKSPDLLDQAKPLQGKRAELEFERDGDRKNLLSIKEAASENGDTPPLGTGEYVRGQTAPTDARRMLGCKAGDIAAALAGQFVGRMPQQEWTPGLICAFYDSLEAHVFHQLLRRGNLMEDSDIPFLPEYEGNG